MNKFYSIICVLLLIPGWCVAEEEKEATIIADSWVMVPKAGHEDQFEAAIKEHMAMRAEKGDSRQWHTYVPITGDNLNHYVVRSCCAEWAEQDSYREWSRQNTIEHFNDTVHPHVQSYSHNFSEINRKSSNWGDDVKANYVGVTHYKVKMGSGRQMNKSIKEMSALAKDNNWPHHWSWSYPVAGSFTVNLAIPFENYAAMAPLEENFYDFIVKTLKSEKKARKVFDDFTGAVESANYQIYRHRKDLSMSAEED
ncbi:MAG: hypothetical protein DWP95_04445 [Proteobacteria bacterium]|nr:MAG: hypothetical protein DWP95_04445 [Pseudomonadota bacterium]